MLFPQGNIFELTRTKQVQSHANEMLNGISQETSVNTVPLQHIIQSKRESCKQKQLHGYIQRKVGADSNNITKLVECMVDKLVQLSIL